MKKPFEQAVAQHGPTVLRVCRADLGPGHDADDAWSETFLAALRAWPDLAEDANVEAWLVRIARRKAIDIVRARARRAVPHGDLRSDPPPGEGAQGRRGAGGQDADGTDGTGIWACVAQLPERQRLAIAYHYLGGLPHTETAALLGSSPAAVRRAAADGLAALRRRPEFAAAEGGAAGPDPDPRTHTAPGADPAARAAREANAACAPSADPDPIGDPA